MTESPRQKMTEGRLVLIAITGVLAAFAVVLVFVSGGGVRHAQIFLPEKAYVTLAFRNIEGEVKLVGIEGLAQTNPTILMRTGDFAMELTLVNQDSAPHGLYIEGLEITSRTLQPGEQQVLTFYSKGEATYNYYIAGNSEPTGQIRALKVTPFE